ncbi:ATP-dependent carboxylate-amine ligase [Natronococcus pandeyae]|uniref:ATP-dependent carboxylate-amine ligase n=1 Tax=Natronococcus pandeyae TaxID=2055836 RepID=A0A8J8Q5J5_9EURY|nr:ATP-grasp domain-containing protein [Natronococcus pandeyae]TYL38988.1 ATP-dependent carboxylate-amine ligase [Natronococcus pandeyae]
MRPGPRVLLLDGDYPTALVIAQELSEDLDATIVGTGTMRHSRLLRSNYCDVAVTIPPVDDSGFLEALWSVIHAHRPQFVLPVGYESAAVLESVRDDLPSFASVCLPDPDVFEVAADKAATMERAAALDIDVPTDYSRLVEKIDAQGRPAGSLEALAFPVFLKARREAGGGHGTTARVADPDQFWDVYDRLEAVAPTGDVLVQECITGSTSTYGCGLFVRDGEIELDVCHEELRSVPRRGGSGTHLRLCRDPELETAATELLREIDWHGVALVEFKRRASGELVLMEINPKFWASYALASAHGYRFASTMVATVLGLEDRLPDRSPQPDGEMVFPLRELYYYARNREEERLLECLRAVAKPGVPWDVDRSDLGAWLTPPAGLVRKLPTVDRSRSPDHEPVPLTRR